MVLREAQHGSGNEGKGECKDGESTGRLRTFRPATQKRHNSLRQRAGLAATVRLCLCSPDSPPPRKHLPIATAFQSFARPNIFRATKMFGLAKLWKAVAIGRCFLGGGESGEHRQSLTVAARPARWRSEL